MQAILPDKLIITAGLIPEEDNNLVVWGTRPETSEASYGIALGFFDGIHKGHLALIERLLWTCKHENLISAVYTFDHLPKSKTNGVEDPGGRIQTPENRAAFILAKGVDYVFEQAFSEALRSLSPEAFVDFLCQRFKLRYLVVGDDFRFGYKRQGTATVLQELATKRGVTVDIVAQIKGYGESISSSRIRELLKTGQIIEANRLMGHAFSITGTVIRGRGLARTWGMPTCNMRLPEGQIVLPFGVYVSRTRIGNRFYNSISNIGLRPTLNADEKEPLLETYIFDMSEDLYDQTLEVFILDFQRAESYFPNLEDMVVEMREDIERAKRILASMERLQEITEVSSIPYFHLPSTRFTQSYLRFVFSMPADPRKNSARALAMRIVLQASAEYPTRQAFSLAQDRLYGGSVDVTSDNEGDLQTIEFTAEGIAQGLHGERPFQNLAALLLNALRNPLLDEEGLLDEQLFNTERNNLIMELKSRMQNKAKYAYDRSQALLLEGKAEGISPRGDLAVLETLTRREVSDAWFELLRDGKAAIYTAGKLDTAFHDHLINLLKKFQELGRAPEASIRTVNFAKPLNLETEIIYSEYKDVEQTRLVMYWGGLAPYPLVKGAVLNVLNSILGGDSHSLLFEKVREEHGLAYSIYSQPLKHLSMIMVAAGINAGQIALAIEDCREQVALIASGDFSERHFMSSVAMVEAKLMSLSDSLNGQLIYQISALEAGHQQDSKEAIEYLHTVTRDNLMEMASSLKELFVYRLLPKGNAEEWSEVHDVN